MEVGNLAATIVFCWALWEMRVGKVNIAEGGKPYKYHLKHSNCIFISSPANGCTDKRHLPQDFQGP